jgi:hypothetical protein
VRSPPALWLDRETEARASENQIRGMTQEAWESLKQESHEVNRAPAELMGRNPGDAGVQQLIARHHAVIEHFHQHPPSVTPS